MKFIFLNLTKKKIQHIMNLIQKKNSFRLKEWEWSRMVPKQTLFLCLPLSAKTGHSAKQ